MKSTSFECDICGFSFKKLEQMKRHKKRVHEEKTRSFICEYCNQSFFQEQHLNVHKERIHEGQKKFKCDEENCTNAFWTQKKFDFTHKTCS